MVRPLFVHLALCNEHQTIVHNSKKLFLCARSPSPAWFSKMEISDESFILGSINKLVVLVDS